MTRAGALTITRNATTGRPTQTTTGSITETYSFSNLGELSSSVATCGGTTLRSISLARDNAGQITAQDETILGLTDSITYDHHGRGSLTGVHHGAVSSTYSYDGNGNRLSASRPELVSDVYDAQDRLVQQGSTTYVYTASGQLKSKTEPSGTTSYHYDRFGNLRSAQLADGRTVTHLIDGMNRRIGKQVNGTIVQGWLYGGAGLVIAELDGGGAVVSRFVYGTRSNVPDYMVKGGVTYRILSDIVGSPRLIVNAASCQVVQRIDYDEFGRVASDTNPGFQPFGFAGGLLDRDTGLIRFGARDYDPEIGRWTAKDPAGFGGGDTNLYVYAGNNPVNFMDPTGLGFWQGLTDLSAGFGDHITFGFTRWVRKKLDVDSVVNPCSGLYGLGGIAADVAAEVITAGVVSELIALRRAKKYGQHVYQLVDETGEAVYYGVSKDPAKRLLWHAKNPKGPFNGMQVVSELLPPPQALALETSLIREARAEGRVLYNAVEDTLAATGFATEVPIATGLFKQPTVTLLNPAVYW